MITLIQRALPPEIVWLYPKLTEKIRETATEIVEELDREKA